MKRIALVISLAVSTALIQGCGGSSPEQTQAAGGTTVKAAPLFNQAIQIGDIDKGTFCYVETVNPSASVSDLKSAFNGSNWLATITGVYGRRWPSGQALAQAQANDQYFKNFVDTSSFNKLAESLMVAIHEETHMWDLASGRTEWNNYTSAWVDNSYQFNRMPLHDGFARKEILSLIKDDASSDTDKVYLQDASQGEYHLQGVTAELNASLMGLPAALMVAEFIDGIGASNSRDLALTNLSYLQLYLRIAKQKYPAFWQQLKAEPDFRKFVLVQFLRTSYWIDLSTPWAAKLGSNKVAALIQRVYAPENIAIIEELTGYVLPRQLSDHCMGNTTPSAPVINTQPQSQTAQVGQSVSFNVSAAGGGLHFQWRKNAQVLTNAADSPSLTLNNLSLADAGKYSVVVSNQLGSVSSAEATLIVNPAGAQELLKNGSFESGAANWQGTTAAIGNFKSYGHNPYDGNNLAWLGGQGVSATEQLYQQISIPAAAYQVKLSFYMAIKTAETGNTAKDKLQLQVANTSGTVLATLATYSNLNANSNYQLYTLDLSAYRGQTVRLVLKMTEDARLQTSFLVDKLSVSAQ